MQLTFNNSSTPKYLTEFANFACQYLGLYKLRGDIEVEYKYGALEEDVFGLCWGDSRECTIHIATKQWGNPIGRKEKLMTLAHELTHAKQYLTRELIAGDTDEYVTRWHGKDIHYNPKTEKNQPWETEASKYEQLIYDAWIESQQ